MRKLNTEQIEETLYDLILKVGVCLTPDCVDALNRAKIKETNALSKYALEICLENNTVANEQQMPVCQDTGLAVVVIEIGQEVFLTGKSLTSAVNDAVKRAYKDGFFRKSTCDPITRNNYGDNTPAMLYTEIVDGDKVTISFMPKGFGSENMSKIFMLTPASGVDGIIESIVQTVKDAGSRPCPPIIVGVGIGGTFDKCAYLAKKALMRPIGTFNQREDVKQIEQTALNKINELKIGAQGFGGDVTALQVSCEVYPTHIAALPVAVNIQCHAMRFGREII